MDVSIIKIPWLIASIPLLGVAVLFVFVVPQKDETTLTPWQRWIVRWGHATVWLLLALGFAAQAFSYPGALLSFTLMAFAMSVLFVVTLLRN